MNTVTTHEYLLGRRGDIQEEIAELKRTTEGEDDASECVVCHASIAALYAQLSQVEEILADLVGPADA